MAKRTTLALLNLEVDELRTHFAAHQKRQHAALDDDEIAALRAEVAGLHQKHEEWEKVVKDVVTRFKDIEFWNGLDEYGQKRVTHAVVQMGLRVGEVRGYLEQAETRLTRYRARVDRECRPSLWKRLWRALRPRKGS